MALFAHLFPLLREAADCFCDLLCICDKKLFWKKADLMLLGTQEPLERPPSHPRRGRQDADCSWNP